jgi:hypothetical protein
MRILQWGPPAGASGPSVSLAVICLDGGECLAVDDELGKHGILQMSARLLVQ